MNRKDILFIVVCILAVATVIVYVFVSSAIYKKTEAEKSPYYYCDGSWTCCNTDSCDVPATKSLEPLDSATIMEHVKNLKDTPLVYKPSDYWSQGSNYHQNCVLPVQNAILNWKENSTQTFNFDYIYNGANGSTGANNPSIFAVGCTGYGGATGTKCADPKYNVQVQPSCPYISVDGGGTNAPNTPGIGGGSTYSLVGTTSIDKTNSYTLNSGNWKNATNINTFSGVSSTGDINYGCAGLGSNTKLQNCQTPGSTQGNSTNNLMNPSYIS